MLLFEEWRKLEYIVPEEKPRRVGREPTTNSTHIWRQRQDLCPGHIGESRVLSPLRHPCYRLLKTSDYRRLLTEVIVLHRDGLGDLLRCQSQSHFAKWQINIKLFLLIFFSVKTIARNLGKMYHSLTAGHLQLDESVRLNTLVIRCFFTSSTTVSKLLSPFHKKRGHEKSFSLTTTNSARLKQRHNQGTTSQF